MNRSMRLVLGVAIAALLGSSCGGSAEPSDTDSTAAPRTTVDRTTAATEPVVSTTIESTDALSTTPESTTTISPPGDTTEEPIVSPPFVNTWTLIEETGGPPGAPDVEPGVDYFVVLTLGGSDFSSEYSDTFGQDCEWSGTISQAPGTLGWATTESTGPPCSQAIGRSGPVTWSMPDGSTLVLDFSEGFEGGTVQTYSRA